MSPRRRSPTGDSTSRRSLLDAAQRIMLEEGYAAVTSRRIAAMADVNVGLVYYYFTNMDQLFVELFRRGAERSLSRLEHVLDQPQPLWGLWDLIHDYSSNALTMEFIALANHRKELKVEIAAWSGRFRLLQLEKLQEVLAGYGVDLQRWPVASLLILMAGTSRFMLIEEGFDVDLGHRQTVEVIERLLGEVEGTRPGGRHAAAS